MTKLHMPFFAAHRAPRLVVVATAAAAFSIVGSGCGSGTNGSGSSGRDRHASNSTYSPPHSLTLGFSSDSVLVDGPPTDTVWIPRAVAEGAQMVRVNVWWSKVAPATPPAGFEPANPASPGYNWSATDAAVRDLNAHGLKPLIDVLSAPAWAEGPGRPAYEPRGTWRPDPAKFAAFATAIARRYDGRFPDPENPGGYLPRVRYWQPWNEPNLDEHLSPQWSRSGHGWVDTSPVVYRQLLNAFYAAVNRVSTSNFVVTAGTSPYGDLSPTYHRPGHQRMPPVRFYRDLFCLHGQAALRPTSCSGPAHLDAIDSHIYGVYGPLWHAANRDDVAAPDMYKLADVLRAAERAGTALPGGPKRLWVTEISWTSKPPASFGVSLARNARWYEQSMYLLWRQGVDTVLLLQVRDAAPKTSGPWGGLYFFNGLAKPAATAFRFPFVTQRVGGDRVQVWGLSPRAGKLTFERRNGRRWTAIQTLRVGRHEVFLKTIALRGAATLRAQVGDQTSLAWTQGA